MTAQKNLVSLELAQILVRGQKFILLNKFRERLKSSQSQPLLLSIADPQPPFTISIIQQKLDGMRKWPEGGLSEPLRTPPRHHFVVIVVDFIGGRAAAAAAAVAAVLQRKSRCGSIKDEAGGWRGSERGDIALTPPII